MYEACTTYYSHSFLPECIVICSDFFFLRKNELKSVTKGNTKAG